MCSPPFLVVGDSFHLKKLHDPVSVCGFRPALFPHGGGRAPFQKYAVLKEEITNLRQERKGRTGDPFEPSVFANILHCSPFVIRSVLKIVDAAPNRSWDKAPKLLMSC